jgi:tetratricopeptide (TPR) repeat protein
MRSAAFDITKAIFVSMLVAIISGSSLALAGGGQEPGGRGGRASQVSPEERQAAGKIALAADAAGAIQAATEFLAKYPKSTLRSEAVRRTVSKVAEVGDTAQQVTLLESTLNVFKEPADGDIINPVLADAYIKVERFDDAFRVGAIMVGRNADDVVTLTQLALVGFDQAKRGNAKFVGQSQQYALKAVTLIEAEKRPQGFEDAQWNEYKTRWLGQLYQSIGIVAMMTGNKEEARAKLEKAATVNPNDPITYMVLGGIVQEEYTQLAQQLKSMTPGAAQTEALKKAHEKIDQMVELYARAVGLAEGNPQYQRLHDELLKDLTTYYSYRHNGSTAGLQQLIDKYKRPQTPQ